MSIFIACMLSTIWVQKILIANLNFCSKIRHWNDENEDSNLASRLQHKVTKEKVLIPLLFETKFNGRNEEFFFSFFYFWTSRDDSTKWGKWHVE